MITWEIGQIAPWRAYERLTSSTDLGTIRMIDGVPRRCKPHWGHLR
jgi:hypothetical protein